MKALQLKSSARSLENKKALVTGATGGMGLAIVERLASAGVKVIAHGRDLARLDKLRKDFPGIIIKQADLRNIEQVEKLAYDSLKVYDGLDILINNAGIGVHKNVLDLHIDEYEAMMQVNLRAVFILSKIIGQAMVSRKSGYIINIGSGASTTPIAGLAAYCATKHGLLGFSESLGLELRSSGVKVSIIMPGSTATRFGGNR
jgi:short-subunit dehydrogenase